MWFHKRQYHRCDLVFFVADFNRGQLNLDRFEFWLLTSRLWALDVCMFDAFE
nr:DUF645 family protein [Vibrio cholerae]